MLTWKQFTGIPNGTEIFNHGWNQCVALANHYHERVIGGSFVGVPSAYMWWTNFGGWGTLTENYTTSSRPVAGAIFVARYGIYDAPNGHIGVVTSVNSDGSFNTMEQNAGTWRFVGRYTRGMQNILGFLVPKDNPAQAATPPPAHADNKPSKVQEEKDEDEMKNSGFTYTRKSDGAIVYLILNTVSGFYQEYTAGRRGKTLPGKYNNPVAAALGTGDYAPISESHANAIKRSADQVRTGK